MSIDRIVEKLRSRNKGLIDIVQKVRETSLRDRQQITSNNLYYDKSLVQKLGRRKAYRVKPSRLTNNLTDSYGNDLVISQLKIQRRSIYDASLDIGKIKGDYQVFVNDNSIINPFVISRDLARIINNHTKNLSSDEEKARAIFDWFENNIEYGNSNRRYGYNNATETLQNREGVCGEMAYLYITMARSVNLKSSYVHVDMDNYGKRVNHACAVVDIGLRNVFVDPAYHQYDIKHKDIKIQTDAQVINLFEQWRKYESSR